MLRNDEIFIPDQNFWEKHGLGYAEQLRTKGGDGSLKTPKGSYFIFNGDERDFTVAVARPGFSVSYSNTQADNRKTKLSLIGNELSQPKRVRHGELMLGLPGEKGLDFYFALGERVLRQLKVVEVPDIVVKAIKGHMEDCARDIVTRAMPRSK